MTSRTWRIAALILAALFLHLALVLPNHPQAATPAALLLFPLELPALLLAMIAMPARGAATRTLRILIVVLLVLLVVLKLADFAMFTAFGRPFNVVSDMVLLDAGWRLSSGTVGPALAALGIAAVLLVLAFLTSALWWSTGRWVRVVPTIGWRTAAAVGAVAATAFAIAEIGHVKRQWRLPFDPPGAAFTARVGYERAILYRDTLADLARFQQAARTDPLAGREGLFGRLEGRHVEIVFVESYGRTSFDNELYAPTHVPTLEKAEDALAEAGLAMRSGWLTSPISGGQSWLAHATLATGLKIDGQTRYAAMLGSPRLSLYDLAAGAGYRTAAVMPAITMAWPEAEILGFEDVLASTDMGYRGKPFNWVTMPDQFTLARYDGLLGGDGRPRFVQMALISSHAPWVPVAELVPWDEIGDGTIFDRWATAGDPPEIVWRDPDRVRDQYRLSIDYSLQALFAHISLREGDQPLTVVLGDHPPAAFVSQVDSFDVPIHVVGTPEMLELFDAWDWTEGLIPSPALPSWPMEAFRDRFVDAVAPPGDGR